MCETVIWTRPRARTPEEHRRRKRRFLDCYKTSRGCKRCGDRSLPARCYDLHHRDPTTKTIPANRLAIDAGWPRLLLEIAKCDVLCANCHRIVELELERQSVAD